MRSSRRLGWALIVFGLGGAPGCNEGGESETPASDLTSGGEDSSSSAGSAEQDRALQAPPGSRPPGEAPDGDLEQEARSTDPATPSGGTPGAPATVPGAPQAGAQPTEPSSPWGQPETESGRPSPPRRPMGATARSHYQRGLQLAGQGNAAGATEAFQAALSADPNAFQAAYNLGVMADRADQEGRAIQFYQQALRVQPDYERAIEGIARIHLRRGNVAEAIAYVQPLAEQWQRNLHLQAVFGNVLVQANRPEEGVAAARRALRRDERFVPAMVVLVKANLRLGRTELAESVLTQALEVTGQLAELHFLRGRMYQDQGQLTPALESYRRAIELEPGYVEARMALGLQQLAAGNYNDALAQFQTAAQLAPTLVGVRLALGDAYRATRQWQQSMAEFDRAREMDPRNAQVHFNLGMLYREAGGDFPGLDVIEAYQRAVTELNRYRELLGARISRSDPSQAYLDELGRLIQREQQARERERARQQREAERAARQAAERQAAEQQAAEQAPAEQQPQKR